MKMDESECPILEIINSDKYQSNLRYPLPLYLVNENWLIP